MARLVEFTAKEPIRIEPQKRAIWICACGLSKNFPYCDGSHRKTEDEPNEELVQYDKHGQRTDHDNGGK